MPQDLGSELSLLAIAGLDGLGPSRGLARIWQIPSGFGWDRLPEEVNETDSSAPQRTPVRGAAHWAIYTGVLLMVLWMAAWTRRPR